MVVLLHRGQIALSRDRGRAGEDELAVGSNSVVFHQGTLREVLRRREEHLEELVAQLVGRFPQVDRRRRALPVDRADRLGQRLDRVLVDANVVDYVDAVKLFVQLTDYGGTYSKKIVGPPPRGGVRPLAFFRVAIVQGSS